MSGGSKGGGSDDWRKEKKAAEAAAAAAAAPAVGQTFPAGMPGQLEAIAQQIGIGYGQDPAAVMAYLQQFAKPMTVAPMPEPGKSSSSASAPASSGGGPLGGMNWNDLHPGRPM